jgi:hypothetical protein
VAKQVKPSDVKKIESRTDLKTLKIEISINKMYHQMFHRYLPGYLPKDVYEKLFPPQPAPPIAKLKDERIFQ